MSTTETLREAVRFLFEDKGRDPGPSSIEDEYRRSASVLATFDPARLVTKAGVGPPDADVMQRILRDCEVRRISSGLPRWHLKPDARVRALQTFETRDDLRDTLLANERAESDPIQQAIDGAVLEHRINAESQSPIRLTAALQVVNWFQNVPKEDPLQLPRAEEIQASSELLELKAPLTRLVGQHFVGRASELQQLTDYVTRRDAAPIFAVWGVGGIGKSALLAKYLLDAIQGTSGVSALGVFIDFDRPTIQANEPASVILDAMRQLKPQLLNGPNVGAGIIDVYRDALNTSLSENRTDTTGFGNYFNSSLGRPSYDKAVEILRQACSDRPIIFVLDTFEEVQYRSREFTKAWIDFFSRLRSSLPSSRVIAASRTALLEPNDANQLELEALDRQAAIACLVALGVSERAAAVMFDAIGGNPLSLRLTAELLRKEDKLDSGDAIIHDVEFDDRLRQELVQGTLFRRIIGHIHDEDVRRIAHPGMVLRRITPDIIQRVLAKPCAITVESKRRANDLFHELSRETSIVEIGAESDELRHRADVRQQMLHLILASEPQKVLQVHRAAIKYYGGKRGTIARAEELYHRLALNQKPETLDRHWSVEAESLLRSSIDELPLEARRYFAGKSSEGLETLLPTPSATDQLWQTAGLIDWERHAARRIRDLLNLRHFQEALAVCEERSQRSKESPLFLAQARTLKWLGRWEEAREVLALGIRSANAGTNTRLVLELYLFQLRVAMHLADSPLAMQCYIHARRLAGDRPSYEARLQLLLAELRLREPSASRAIAEQKARLLLVKLPRRVYRSCRKLVNRVAAELTGNDIDIVLRVIKNSGLTQPSRVAIEGLGQALDDWDRRFAPSGRNSKLSVAAGLSRRTGKDEWRQLVARKSAHRDAAWLVRILKVDAPPVAVRNALALFLRGVDDISELQYGEEASALALSKQTDFVLALSECMNRLLPTAKELNSFMTAWIGRDSVSVAPISLPHSARIHEFLKWMESAGDLPKLLAALHSLWQDEEQISSLNHRIGNPTMPGRHFVNAVREWARGYDRLRQEHESGPERTELMTGLVDILQKMRIEAIHCPKLFHLSESAGERLAAVIALRKQIDGHYLRWLSERVTVERPFVGYNAALALLSAAEHPRKAPLQRVAVAVDDALERLQLIAAEDTDRQRILHRAQDVLRKLK